MSDTINIIETNEAGFQQQVIEKSRQVPVLVDFWADWCAPCKMMLPVLEALASDYGEQLVIAKVDTDRERDLAEQNGIRSLPTLRLYRHGEVVEEILGAQPEAMLRPLIDAYIERESDKLLQKALNLDEQGQRAQSLKLMEQAYQNDPDNLRIPLEYARLCIEEQKLERATEILDALPRGLRETGEARNLGTLLEFAKVSSDAPSMESLQSALESNPKQPELRYQLAAKQVLSADYDGALENFLELLKLDRSYGEGAAQRGLLAVFGLLDEQDERITRYRRNMFALLH